MTERPDERTVDSWPKPGSPLENGYQNKQKIMLHSALTYLSDTGIADRQYLEQMVVRKRLRWWWWCAHR